MICMQSVCVCVRLRYYGLFMNGMRICVCVCVCLALHLLITRTNHYFWEILFFYIFLFYIFFFLLFCWGFQQIITVIFLFSVRWHRYLCSAPRILWQLRCFVGFLRFAWETSKQKCWERTNSHIPLIISMYRSATVLLKWQYCVLYYFWKTERNLSLFYNL